MEGRGGEGYLGLGLAVLGGGRAEEVAGVCPSGAAPLLLPLREDVLLGGGEAGVERAAARVHGLGALGLGGLRGDGSVGVPGLVTALAHVHGWLVEDGGGVVVVGRAGLGGGCGGGGLGGEGGLEPRGGLAQIRVRGFRLRDRGRLLRRLCHLPVSANESP